MVVGDVLGDPQTNLFREVRAIGKRIAIATEPAHSPKEAIMKSELQTLNSTHIENFLIVSRDRIANIHVLGSPDRFEHTRHFLSQMEE